MKGGRVVGGKKHQKALPRNRTRGEETTVKMNPEKSAAKSQQYKIVTGALGNELL